MTESIYETPKSAVAPTAGGEITKERSLEKAKVFSIYRSAHSAILLSLLSTMAITEGMQKNSFRLA